MPNIHTCCKDSHGWSISDCKSDEFSWMQMDWVKLKSAGKSVQNAPIIMRLAKWVEKVGNNSFVLWNCNKQDSTLTKTNYSNQKESSTTIKKHKFSFGYSWAWVLLLPFAYFCYWFYKRFVV